MLHNVLEIRYVAGRFAALLTGRFLALLLALISGIAVCRVTATVWPRPARPGEVALGFADLGRRLPARPARRWLPAGLVAAGRWARTPRSAIPAYHFVVLTHLHNLVPLVFLWDWAGRHRRAAGPGWPSGRLRCCGSLVVPLLILAGALDRWICRGPRVADAFVGDGEPA